MLTLPTDIQNEISGYHYPNHILESIPGWNLFQIKRNIQYQFSISSAAQWKDLEFWPDNELTLQNSLPEDLKYKIFFLPF